MTPPQPLLWGFSGGDFLFQKTCGSANGLHEAGWGLWLKCPVTLLCHTYWVKLWWLVLFAGTFLWTPWKCKLFLGLDSLVSQSCLMMIRVSFQTPRFGVPNTWKNNMTGGCWKIRDWHVFEMFTVSVTTDGIHFYCKGLVVMSPRSFSSGILLVGKKQPDWHDSN